MTYSLPANTEINQVRARYKDVNGKEVIVTGSYLSKTMQLIGFNEAKSNVPVNIAYIDKNGVASEEYQTTFNTGDSGPYAFFQNVEVKAGWDGFEVSYDLPEDDMTGFAHVFYVGVNPNTQEQDTLLLNTLTLEKGKTSKFFTMQQDVSETTVVIKTEDFRGYFVRQEEWKGVKSYATKQYEPEKMKIDCPLSYESSNNKWSTEYLTDGDVKGYSAYSAKANEYYTFVMGPWAFGGDIFIDLGESQIPAAIRWYAQMMVKNYYSTRPVWNYNYTDTLPCEVTVYGSNDNSTWTKLGYYTAPQNASGEVWYAKGHVVTSFDKLTLDQVDEAEPVYLNISIPVSDNSYRYLRVVPEKTFDTAIVASFGNVEQYVTAQELEVYVKK